MAELPVGSVSINSQFWKAPNGDIYQYYNNSPDRYVKVPGFNNLSTADVKNYGAVLDGVTDDYEVIQSVIDGESTIVMVGSDTNDSILISQPLSIPSNKIVILNAPLKVKDAIIRPLIADFTTGSTTVQVTDAEQYFKVGDQVCISDDNQPLQAGAPIPQTRRLGRATRVLAISGTEITVESGFNSNITVSANAKIGHVTSAFLTEGATNVTIIGTGSIDMNKANQYDVEPVTMMASREDVRYGVGISINQSSTINISGIKITNAILHALSIYQSQYTNIRDMSIKDYHDKGILLFEATDFTIDNIDASDSEFEDGITIYQNSTRGSISNVRIDNNPRAGINTNAIGVHDINIYNGLLNNNGTGVNLNTVRKVSISKIRVLGGGVNPALDIQDSAFVDADIEVDDALSQDVAVLVSGATTDSKFTVRVYNGNLSSGLGKGIRLQSISANFPNRIIISDSFFSNNKLAVDIASASVSNVIISNNIFSSNANNLINVAASNISIRGNIGLSNQESIVKTFNGATNIEYLKFGTVAVPASGNFVVKLNVTSYSASNTYTGTVVKTYNLVTSGGALTSTTSVVNSVIGTLPGILNIGTPFLDVSGILNIPFMGNSASSRQLMVTAEISGFYTIAYNLLPLSWGTTGTGVFPGGTTASYEPAFNTLPVSKGGTGKQTITSGALQKGNGTGVLTDAVPNTDYVTPSGLATYAKIPTNITSSANTLAIVSGSSYITFTGTTATYTLPVISGNTGMRLVILNSGTGNITLNSNAGAADIWENGVNVTNVIIAPGESYIIYNNSLKYAVIN